MGKNNNLSYLLFGLFTTGELTGKLLGVKEMDYLFKPTLMLWLAFYFWQQTRPHPPGRFTGLILGALFFSWVGDILLMLDHLGDIFFAAGLGCFLTAHLAYIFAFYDSSRKSSAPALLWRMPGLASLLVLPGGCFYFYLYPGLGVMKIPVFVYVLVILTMAIFALNRYGRVTQDSFRLIFAGALLFIISDSCIAFDKFAMPLPLAGFVVMSTYIAAQFLIVRGSIAYIKAT